MDTKHKIKLEVPCSIRNIIYDRDGYSCRICGSPYILAEHHILRRSLGRYHDYCNLVLICDDCHRKIEAGLLPEWNKTRKEELYHFNPVKGYSHYYDYKNILCETHNKPLSEEFKTEPIEIYQSTKQKEVVF